MRRSRQETKPKSVLKIIIEYRVPVEDASVNEVLDHLRGNGSAASTSWTRYDRGQRVRVRLAGTREEAA